MTTDPANTPGGRGPTPGDPLLDAYLDGDVSPPERAAVEQRLAADAGWRNEVELQARIDARLRAVMAPPEAAPVIGAGGPGVERRGAGRSVASGSPWLRAAAALLLAGGVAWAVLAWPWGPGGGESASMGEVRDRLASRGFAPKWVCADDAQMRQYTREHLGTALSIHPGPGVELVGWDYLSGLLGDHAQVLMAKVDGQPSLVVMDRAEADRRQRGAGGGMHLHRREVGGLVMYELSPRATPAILPGVAVAE